MDPLPTLADLGAIVAGTSQIELQMKEFRARPLPADTVPNYDGTWVWGYLSPGQTDRKTHLGPVIVATRGTPTEMKFVNNLGYSGTTKVLAYRYSTDQTLHWADPLNGEANHWNHMAMPPDPGTEGAENYYGPIPAVVHLHGGEVPPVLDGGPDAWFLNHEPDTLAYPHALMHGHSFYSKDGVAATNYSIYRYPNGQEGAPIWFHDHTLGATRLNVYAGLAGGYVLLDPANDPANLPELVPLIIQDRMFDTYGQLFFPTGSAADEQWAPNPEHPYWVPEFIGDAILVNGKTWPFLNVQPKRYTFLFLNGSNARAYELHLENSTTGAMGPPMWVIGTDGGYLDKPVRVGPNGDPGAPEKLVILPGERYQVIIDFAAFVGQTLLLRNTANIPYPNGDAVEDGTTDRIMQFRVPPLPDLNHVIYLPLISSGGAGGGPGGDTSFDPALPGATLRGGANQGPAIVRLVDPVAGVPAPGLAVAKTRQLTLNEVMGMEQTAINPVTGSPAEYPGGPLEILVNNTKWNGKRVVGVTNGMYDMEPIPGFVSDGFGNYLSEIPNEGETEIWEYVNLTADAHPMHTHLTQFQIMNRQAFNVEGYEAEYAQAFPGGSHDPMTEQPYPGGVYIPSFGPPLDYDTPHGGKYGGNPDVTPFLQGDVLPPMPYEAGWKDTIMAPPGMITRIVVRFAPTDLPASTPAASAFFPFDPSAGGKGYVWHCHIVDHEDNEMMRPHKVAPNSAATRTFVMGTDY